MDIKQFLKNLLITASVYFTLITAAYALLTIFVHVGEEQVLLSATQMLYNFLFSLLAGTAWRLYRMPKWSTPARLFIHYGILVLAFYLCFLFPASMRSGQIIIGVILFTLVYAIIMLITAVFVSRFRANAQKVAHYEKQFREKR